MERFINADVMEDVQTKLESIKALLWLYSREFGTPAKEERYSEEDRFLLEVNLITLQDMLLQVIDMVSKAVDKAYNPEP